jgi:hypothetical protein
MLIDASPARGIGRAFLFAVAIAFTFVSSGLVHAGGLTLECLRADVFNPMWSRPIAFVFEGNDRGTLKVGGAFGAFAIPASRRPLRIPRRGTGETIDGVAKAHVKLPSLSDVETCIDKVPGALAADAGSDAFLNARDECMRKLPPASSGVDTVAQIRLAIDGESGGGENAYVVFKLIYDAPSRAPGGKMIVEAFPAQCTLKK